MIEKLRDFWIKAQGMNAADGVTATFVLRSKEFDLLVEEMFGFHPNCGFHEVIFMGWPVRKWCPHG